MSGPTTASGSDLRDLHRNLRLIPVHQMLTHAAAWLPVFVLFTRARFDLDGALLLAAIYYLFVVLLEVPSGWMSDRLGRTLTLRIAAVCWIDQISVRLHPPRLCLRYLHLVHHQIAQCHRRAVSWRLLQMPSSSPAQRAYAA